MQLRRVLSLIQQTEASPIQRTVFEQHCAVGINVIYDNIVSEPEAPAVVVSRRLLKGFFYISSKSPRNVLGRSASIIKKVTAIC